MTSFVTTFILVQVIHLRQRVSRYEWDVEQRKGKSVRILSLGVDVNFQPQGSMSSSLITVTESKMQNWPQSWAGSDGVFRNVNRT